METTNLKHVRICYSNNNHPVQYRYEDNGFDFVGWSVRLVRPNHSMWKCGVEEQVNDRKRLVSTSASLYVNANKNLRHQKHQKENDSKRPSKTNTTDPKQPHHSRLHNHFSWRTPTRMMTTMHTINPSTPQMTTTTAPSTPLTTITPPKAPNFTPLSTPWVKGPNVYFVDRDEC